MKRFAFYLVLILINVVALELLLSYYFFQRRGDYPSAIVFYAVHEFERIRAASRRVEKPIGIYKDDPELGYDHVANSSGRHKSPQFDVKYTIDQDLTRYIPAPNHPRGRIYFLGGSYTFGMGVEDYQTYPYLLATKNWTDWEVKDRAVNGWGTAHAYLVLRKTLEKKSTNTRMIFVYSMIPDHVGRNYIRTEWLKDLAESNRKHPHFEIREGVLKQYGTVGVLEGRAGGDEVRQKELELTSAFLVEMRRLANSNNIPFYVVLLPQWYRNAWGWGDWPPAFIRTLVENHIPFVDLTEMRDRIEYFKNDGHPTAKGHEAIASAISHSIISNEVMK